MCLPNRIFVNFSSCHGASSALHLESQNPSPLHPPKRSQEVFIALRWCSFAPWRGPGLGTAPAGGGLHAGDPEMFQEEENAPGNANAQAAAPANGGGADPGDPDPAPEPWVGCDEQGIPKGLHTDRYTSLIDLISGSQIFTDSALSRFTKLRRLEIPVVRDAMCQLLSKGRIRGIGDLFAAVEHAKGHRDVFARVAVKPRVWDEAPAWTGIRFKATQTRCTNISQI